MLHLRKTSRLHVETATRERVVTFGCPVNTHGNGRIKSRLEGGRGKGRLAAACHSQLTQEA